MPDATAPTPSPTMRFQDAAEAAEAAAEAAEQRGDFKAAVKHWETAAEAWRKLADPDDEDDWRAAVSRRCEERAVGAASGYRV